MDMYRYDGYGWFRAGFGGKKLPLYQISRANPNTTTDTNCILILNPNPSNTNPNPIQWGIRPTSVYLVSIRASV